MEVKESEQKGTFSCDVKNIKPLVKKSWPDKIYVNQILIFGPGKNDIVTKTSCSYSWSYDKFMPKDTSRSLINFGEITVTDAMKFKLEIFAKRTLGRHVLSSYECTVTSIIPFDDPTGGYYPLQPQGEAFVVFTYNSTVPVARPPSRAASPEMLPRRLSRRPSKLDTEEVRAVPPAEVTPTRTSRRSSRNLEADVQSEKSEPSEVTPRRLSRRSSRNLDETPEPVRRPSSLSRRPSRADDASEDNDSQQRRPSSGSFSRRPSGKLGDEPVRELLRSESRRNSRSNSIRSVVATPASDVRSPSPLIPSPVPITPQRPDSLTRRLSRSNSIQSGTSEVSASERKSESVTIDTEDVLRHLTRSGSGRNKGLQRLFSESDIETDSGHVVSNFGSRVSGNLLKSLSARGLTSEGVSDAVAAIENDNKRPVSKALNWLESQANSSANFDSPLRSMSMRSVRGDSMESEGGARASPDDKIDTRQHRGSDSESFARRESFRRRHSTIEEEPSSEVTAARASPVVVRARTNSGEIVDRQSYENETVGDVEHIIRHIDRQSSLKEEMEQSSENQPEEEDNHDTVESSIPEHSVTADSSRVLYRTSTPKKIIPSLRSGRRDQRRISISTISSVEKWDAKGASVAETVTNAMNDRIKFRNEDDEFGDAGKFPGVEIWIVDKGELRKIDEDDHGIFYNADCYVILQTVDIGANDVQWFVHSWIGSKAERDKLTICAFKAKSLAKYFNNARHVRNDEGEESDELVYCVKGRLEVMEGSCTESTLRHIHSRQSEVISTTVRLLSVSVSPSSSEPFLKNLPRHESSLESDQAYILDTGGPLIYQWRGVNASHVARARVFEAAFSLRSERIIQFGRCQIEVVDENSEPKEFWEIFHVPQRERLLRRDSGLLSEINLEGDEDKKSDEVESESSEEEASVEEESIVYADTSSEDSSSDEEDDVLFDMEDIEGYCQDQMEGHAELQRRLHRRSSGGIEGAGSTDDLELNDYGHNTSNSLYRIGYVDNKLHTSRISGINSNGEDFGPLRRDALDPKGVFLLDCDEDVYVWMGRGSAAELRVAGVTIAKALVMHCKPEWVKVVSVLEGEEPIMFKSKFPGWHEGDMIASHRSSREILSPTAHRRHSEIKLDDEVVNKTVGNMIHNWKEEKQQSSRKLHRSKSKSRRTICRSVKRMPVKSPLDDMLALDDGKGVTVIWRITDDGLRAVPKDEYGHFWTHESYVILYGFSFFRSRSPTATDSGGNTEEIQEFVLYFWQGIHSKEKAYPHWKLGIFPQKKTEWLEQMGRLPTEIRIFQSSETEHFFRVFRHRYIIHFPFLHLMRQRAKALQKVERIQSEILKNEKQRASYFPRHRVFLKRNHRRANRLRLSDEGRPYALTRENSTSSILSLSENYTNPKTFFNMETTAGVLLFQVKSLGTCDADVHAVQIEAKASRLNSSDCFIAIRPFSSTNCFIWLWVGRGTQFFEQEAAGHLALKLLKWVGYEGKTQVRVIEEGAAEWFSRWIAKSFYRALGGFDLYSNFDLLQTPRSLRPVALRYPTLFVCDITRGEYSVTMLRRYSQRDLVPAGAAILDAHFALFCWFGRSCSGSLRVISMKVASKFLNALHQGSKRQDIQIFPVEQDHEPPPFITCFHGWCSWRLLEKTFIDPHDVRMGLRSKMGMLGDMAGCIGRSIPHIPPEELKKREKIAKKKKQAEMAKSPQKDSIRERIRERCKEMSKPPPPPPVVPGTAVADASFYKQLPEPATPTTIVSDALRNIGGALSKRYSERTEIDGSSSTMNGHHIHANNHAGTEQSHPAAIDTISSPAKSIKPSRAPTTSPKKDTPHARERLRRGPTVNLQKTPVKSVSVVASTPDRKRHSLPQYETKKKPNDGTPSVSEALRKYTPPRGNVAFNTDGSPRSQISSGKHHLTPTTASQCGKREKCVVESASPPFSPYRTIPLAKLDIYGERTSQDEDDSPRHGSPIRAKGIQQSITRRIVSAAKMA